MVVSQLLGYQELNSGTFKSYIISPLHCRIIPLATVAISNADLVTLTTLSWKTIIATHLQSSVHHAARNSNRLNSHFPLPSPSLRPSPPHSVAVYLTAPAGAGKQNHTRLACSGWPLFSVHPCCEECWDFIYSFLWVNDVLRVTDSHTADDHINKAVTESSKKI